jgi:hypothetical protein
MSSIAAGAQAVPAYRTHVVTRTEGDVRASVAALSGDESRAEYGVPLADKGIQPVWIEIENRGPRQIWLLSAGVDPGYFPASEVAEVFPDHRRRILDRAFRNPIAPGSTVSGFVLTHASEGAKLVQLDLIASQWSQTLLMFAKVPGLHSDYERSRVFTQDAPAAGTPVEYASEESFHVAVQALPCCVTNQDGTRNGDPLNLVIVGSLEDAFPALVRRGWTPTETTRMGSVMRMADSVISGERYPYAPISNLYLYGRPQDVAMQKARDSIHQRNHLRLWKSAMTWQGKPVWVGQVSRDIGSRMTIHSPTLTTHKIDPDVDSAALALAGDMAYSQNLQAAGLSGGGVVAPRKSPQRNLTGDPYFTAGLRLVLVFDHKPTSIADIEIFPWEFTLEDPTTRYASPP